MFRRSLVLALALLVSGCGFGSSPAQVPTPVAVPDRAEPIGPGYAYILGVQGGLEVIDPEAGKRLHSLAIPNGSQVAVSADGQVLWLLTPGRLPGWRVRPVSTATWHEGESTAFAGLADYKLFTPYVSVSRDGRWLFAIMRKITGPGQDTLWVEVYNTQERKWLQERLEPGCRPWRLVAADDGAAVLGLCEGKVAVMPRGGGPDQVVNLPGQTRQGVVNSEWAVGGAVGPDAVHIAQRDGTVAVLHTGMNRVLTHVRLDLPEGWGVGMSAVASDSLGHRLYVGVGDPVTHGQLKEVWVLDDSTLQVVARHKAPEPFGSLALSLDGRSLYLLAGKTLHVMEPGTGKVVRQVAVGNALSEPAFVMTAGGP